MEDAHQMAKNCLPNSELEFMQQIDHEQIVVVETKIAELGREGVLE
jgi:hypothetical protein